MVILIGGTTASGKSSLAFALAKRLGAAIVNADSRQVYRDLPILTARPTAQDEARVPHHLYGYLPAQERNSVWSWLERVRPIVEEATSSDRDLVVVGGTGLYLEALLEGMSAIPDVPEDVRQAVHEETDALATLAIHELLCARDPIMAQRLKPSDRQRMIRALEVVAATGISLAEWQQSQPCRIALPEKVYGLAILPDRDTCALRIERRFLTMIEHGALEELKDVVDRVPDFAATPLATASGAKDLLAHLEGTVSLDDAIERSVIATRQYAKRQRTWFRNRMGRFRIVEDIGDNLDAEKLISEFC